MSKSKEQIYAEVVSIITETVAKSITASRLGGVLQDILDSIPDSVSVPTKVSELDNDADYAKKSELPDTSGLLSETKAAQTYQPKGEYLTEHQSLADYAKTTDLPTVPTKVSAFENDAKYLTTQSLADYAKKTDLSVKQDKLNAGSNISISGAEISALPFDKVVKYASDDAARQILGGDWRIPTSEEWGELIQNCTWTKVTSGESGGFRISAPNGNSIFIPFFKRTEDYWTSRKVQSSDTHAVMMAITSTSPIYAGNNNASVSNRCEPARIRPVSSIEGVDLGLSVRWAASNLAELGLEDEETGRGGEFAWAETEPKDDFSWSNYKFNPSGDGKTMTKYNLTDKLNEIELASKEYAESKEYEDIVVKKDLSPIVNLLLGKQPLIDEDNKLPYDYIEGTPVIPTKTSQLVNDSLFATVGALGDMTYWNHSGGTEFQLMAEIALEPWQTVAAVFSIASKNTGTGTVSFHLQTGYLHTSYTVNLVYHGTPTVASGSGFKVYRNDANNKLYLWLVQNDYSPCFIRIQNKVNINFSIPSTYYSSIPSGYTLVKSMDII